MRSPSLSLALGALALVAACTPPALPPAPPPPPRPAPAPTVTPDAPFRGQAPAPAPEPTFVPPVIAQAALSNGVPVLLVERHDMPVVEVRIVVRRGGEVGRCGLYFALPPLQCRARAPGRGENYHSHEQDRGPERQRIPGIN